MNERDAEIDRQLGVLLSHEDEGVRRSAHAAVRSRSREPIPASEIGLAHPCPHDVERISEAAFRRGASHGVAHLRGLLQSYGMAQDAMKLIGYVEDALVDFRAGHIKGRDLSEAMHEAARRYKAGAP